MRTQWFFCGEHPAKYGWVCAGILRKWQTALRVKGLHSAEEECKSFLTALHARMTCTNHVRSVTSFNAVTWKTHVRILREAHCGSRKVRSRSQFWIYGNMGM